MDKKIFTICMTLVISTVIFANSTMALIENSNINRVPNTPNDPLPSEGDVLIPTAADINGNGIVNFQDCGLIWIHRGEIVDPPGSEPYDVDCDGDCDLRDLNLVSLYVFNSIRLGAFVSDPDNDNLDVSFYLYDGTLIGSLEDVPSDTHATITFNDLSLDKTYSWFVIVDDGQETMKSHIFCFTLKSPNCYDVNNDGIVDFSDALLVWEHRDSVAPYEEIYDVNDNGIVNFQDAGLIWINRDEPDSDAPPIIYNEKPEHGSIDVERPPASLSAYIFAVESETLDVTIFIYRPDGSKEILKEFENGLNGIYSCEVPIENDFIYGDTMYTWGVEVSDEINIVTEEFQYTTGGSRYDVNNDGRVNYADLFLVWRNRDSVAPYDGIYDVNNNGLVNFQDAGLVYRNMD